MCGGASLNGVCESGFTVPGKGEAKVRRNPQVTFRRLYGGSR